LWNYFESLTQGFLHSSKPLPRFALLAPASSCGPPSFWLRENTDWLKLFMEAAFPLAMSGTAVVMWYRAGQWTVRKWLLAMTLEFQERL
jgi:hypothetical protein